MVNYDKVPNESMKRDVKRYVETGKCHGDFLHALLSNNLVASFTYADLENKKKLDEWSRFIYNELPMNSWGDAETVENWEGLENEY